VDQGGRAAAEAAGGCRAGVLTEKWRARIAELVGDQRARLSTPTFDVLVAEGLTGSYVTVVRAGPELRGPRFKAAKAVSMPSETARGPRRSSLRRCVRQLGGLWVATPLPFRRTLDEFDFDFQPLVGGKPIGGPRHPAFVADGRPVLFSASPAAARPTSPPRWR